MTARYDLLIASMQAAAHTVTIIAALALTVITARWSIKYIPDAPMVRNVFDLWLVAAVLILFVISK